MSTDTSFPLETGIKSNLSIRGCEKSPFYNSYNYAVLGSIQGPLEENFGGLKYKQDLTCPAISMINPGVLNSKRDKFFKPTDDGKGYTTNDPRQFDAARAIRIVTDEVPINGKVFLKNIYTNNDTRSYNYHNNAYENINDGQISYYVDRSIQGPFFKPVYSQTGEETAVIFQDPMGAMKPEYNRKLNYQNLYQPNCGFRAIQDSQFFREDLMSLQQRKHNQEKWSARWEQEY
jgi:hypothetical protein